MSGPLQDLDAACPTCSDRVGGHTLDRFNECFSTPSLDLAYEEVPGGPIPLLVAGTETHWADHLHARAAVVGGGAGSQLRVAMPAVIFTFEIGNPSGLPRPVTEVAFVGPPETVRTLGKVLRDTCNGAANAAERTA